MAKQIPQVTMDINQDPYQLLGQGGVSNRNGAASAVNIESIVGADLARLDMPQMLEVLRGVYERKGAKLVYRPRAFRIRSQAGTLTDIQASLYKRFQVNQEEINHLLDQLIPLIPDADKENCDSIRELVRDDVSEIVDEAGWLGGPRDAKMTAAFNRYTGHIRQIEKQFGLLDQNVNTLSEAETLSRFITIQQIVSGMSSEYQTIKNQFDRSGAESFGNQTYWLVKSMNMVRERSVQLQFQLRARQAGAEELATRLIPNLNMTIAELLDWTAEVCDKGSVISPRAGRDGMRSLATDLGHLKDGYIDLQANRKNMGIDELKGKQIKNTIQEVIEAIDHAIAVAQQKAVLPQVKALPFRALAPENGRPGQRLDITITGSDFDQKKVADWTLIPIQMAGPDCDISAIGNAQYIDSKHIRFTITIAKGAKPMSYNFYVYKKKADFDQIPGEFNVL